MKDQTRFCQDFINEFHFNLFTLIEKFQYFLIIIILFVLKIVIFVT